MNSPSDIVQALHEKLVGGDPTASAEIAELILPRIATHLSIRFRGSDEHDVMEAAADAVLEYLADPSKYDPTKAKLVTFLKAAADRDMMNFLAKQGRRECKIEIKDPVELYESDGNRGVGESQDPVGQEYAEYAAAKELDVFIQTNFENTVDRELVQLVLDDVRETEEYVSVLGIGGLDELSQRAEVKRHKDRIKVKLKRLQKLKSNDE